MERVTHYRPRVSRETRLLVTTALLAVLALWMLARLRFPAPPAEPRAIAGILSSLGTGGDFDGLATQVARVRAIVGPSLVAVQFETPASGSVVTTTRSALRIGGDLAVVPVPSGTRLRVSEHVALVAWDPASTLALIRLPIDPITSASTLRLARPPQAPQYVIASTIYPDGVTLRPVFLAASAAVDAPLWSAMVWVVPAETGLTPGSFLFTRNGEFVGMTISHRGAVAFVSSDIVLDEANRLLERSTSTPVDYGVQVEALSPPLQRALGATTGVVVTWIDPNGAARDALAVGDVIESANGQTVPTVEHWQRHVAGLSSGAKVSLSVRRGGALRSVSVMLSDDAEATGPESRNARLAFGARTRAYRGLGVEVMSVEPESLASRAGLVVGDVITFVGTRSAPTPAQVAEVAGALRNGQSVLVGVRRGDERRLLVLER